MVQFLGSTSTLGRARGKVSTFHQRSQAHEEGTHKGCPYRDWRREGGGALWYTCGDDSDRLRSLCRDYTFDQTAGPAGRHRPAGGSGRSDDNPPDRGGRAAHRPRAGAGCRRRYAHPDGHPLGLCGAGWALSLSCPSPASPSVLASNRHSWMPRLARLSLSGRSNWWQEGRRSPFHPRPGILQATQARQFQISPIGLLIGLFMLMAIFSFVYGMSHSRPTTTIIRRFGEILLGIGLLFRRH